MAAWKNFICGVKSMSIKSYEIELEILSPVHVGSGDKLTKADFAYDNRNKRLGLIDGKKWVEYLQKQGLLEEYIQYLEENANYPVRTRNNRIRYENRVNNYAWLMSKGIDIWKVNPFSYILDGFQAGNRMNDVSAFIKNEHHQPYIPGSTIKGLIRTACVSVKIFRDREKYARYWNDFCSLNSRISTDRNAKKELNRLALKIEETALEKIDLPKVSKDTQYPREIADPFRGLLISDSKPLPFGSITLQQKKDWGEKSKRTRQPNPVSLWRECLKPGTRIIFNMTLNTAMTSVMGINDAEDLIKILSDYSNNILYELYEEKLIQYMPQNYETFGRNKNRPVLLVGGGVGFHAKSIILALAPSDTSARKETARLLDQLFTKPNRKLRIKVPMHNHQGQDHIVSPRTVKLSDVEENVAQMGQCRFKVVREIAV
jgi:CRISPR-associated protein Csm5